MVPDGQKKKGGRNGRTDGCQNYIPPAWSGNNNLLGPEETLFNTRP